MARAPMVMPSMTRSGYSLRISRSLKVPGSPSSALHMMYLGVRFSAAAKFHLMPVGKPAPPRPLSLESRTMSMMSTRDMASALLEALARRDGGEGELVALGLDGVDAHAAHSTGLAEQRRPWRLGCRLPAAGSPARCRAPCRASAWCRSSSFTSMAGPWSHMPMQLAHSRLKAPSAEVSPKSMPRSRCELPRPPLPCRPARTSRCGRAGR